MKTRNLNTSNLLYVLVVWSVWFVYCSPSSGQTGFDSSTGDADDEIRKSIQRAIVPIERAMVGYREDRRCFSCHHHAHAIIGLSELARRGLNVDRELLRIQLVRTVSRTQMEDQRYRKNQNIGGGVDTTGYALLAMHIGGHQRDDATEAMIAWLLKRSHEQGFWTGTKNRAPTQTSDITRTWLCLEAFEHFGTPNQFEEIAKQKAKTRKWLLNVDASSTEDQVSRIRALAVIGDASKEIKKFAEALVQEQKDDGGWVQADDLACDAYATGSVLMTLHQHAGLSTEQEFYRRGVAFLESTQLDDGTWHVKTRATPVQEYFESGFPHDRDQYISITATCWAATAMALTLQKPAPKEHPSWVADLSLPVMKLDADDHRQFQARFDQEIWPLISDNGKSSCIRCHKDKHRSSFRLTGDSKTDFAMMLGQGVFHPHDPSGILYAITSANPKMMMPPSKLPRWKDEQVAALKKFAIELYQLQKPELK